MIWLTDLLDDKQLHYYLSQFVEDNFHHCPPPQYGAVVKNCSVMTPEYMRSDQYKTIAHQCWKDISLLQQDYLLKNASQPYFVWYNEGQYYDWHRDNFPCGGVNSDISMSIFLNDDYEGGELLIKVGDAVTEHKPKAGTVVLYDTGLWHCIKPVTKGSRKVIVGWHESLIQNSFIRRELIAMGRELSKDEMDWNALKQIHVNLIREYGRPIG